MNESECESVFAALSAFLDGELPPADCEELERHIQGCEPCVDFVNSLRKSIRLGKQYQPEEPTPAIAPEVRHNLESAYRSMLARQSKKPQGA
jgi:anti-sigma factor RsiW